MTFHYKLHTIIMNTEKFTPEQLFELLKKHGFMSVYKDWQDFKAYCSTAERDFTALLSDLPITALEAERDMLAQWKSGVLTVFKRLDSHKWAKALGARLGEDPAEWGLPLHEDLARMVTAYVEGGIKLGTDWRNGLSNIIKLRMDRRPVRPVGGQTVHISTIDGQSIEEWKQNCDLLRSREAEQSRTVNRAREELTAAKAALAECEKERDGAWDKVADLQRDLERDIRSLDKYYDEMEAKVKSLQEQLSALSWHPITDPPTEADADRNGNVEWLVESGDTFSSPWDQQIADLLQSTPVDGLPLKFWRRTNLPSPQPAPVEDDGFEAWWIKHGWIFSYNESDKKQVRKQYSASRAQKGGEL